MLTFLTAAATLSAVTALTARTAMRWPQAGRDLPVAAVAVFVAGAWVLAEHAVNGPALWTLTPSHALRAVDLAVVPVLALAGLLAGRTILLRRLCSRPAPAPAASAERATSVH